MLRKVSLRVILLAGGVGALASICTTMSPVINVSLYFPTCRMVGSGISCIAYI